MHWCDILGSISHSCTIAKQPTRRQSPRQPALNIPELSQCDIIEVPVVSSSGARDILQLSPDCDAAVSLREPDRQRGKDDRPGARFGEQVETIDWAPGSNYELNPMVCSTPPTVYLSNVKSLKVQLKSTFKTKLGAD